MANGYKVTHNGAQKITAPKASEGKKGGGKVKTGTDLRSGKLECPITMKFRMEERKNPKGEKFLWISTTAHCLDWRSPMTQPA